MSDALLTAQGLHKSYRMGRVDLHVLRGVSLSLQAGEFVAVVGASGSGKSTLLHIVGLLDRPDCGKVIIESVDTVATSPRRRDRIRCRDIGFVFQFYHLLGELNVLENTLLPARVDASVLRWLTGRQRATRQAVEILQRLGLGDRLNHRPSELSGGQRQRVAIARALVNGPKLLLVDEPTGNLDSEMGRQIIDVLKDFNLRGQTVLMVTHDLSLAAHADRILHLIDGQLQAD